MKKARISAGLSAYRQIQLTIKMALWCYLLPNWSINNLKVAPGLTGSELDIGNRILAAAKDIYQRGTTYNYMLDPRMSCPYPRFSCLPAPGRDRKRLRTRRSHIPRSRSKR